MRAGESAVQAAERPFPGELVELTMRKLLDNFAKNEDGAALIEYSILIGLIAVAVITAVTAIGGWITGRWNTLNGALNPAP